MMLAQNPWSFPMIHAPRKSSPLSPRDTNSCFRHQMQAMADRKSDVPFSRRPVKANPVVQNRDSRAQQRRNLFLKKIQDKRDDQNYETRMDELLRLDYLAAKKLWHHQPESQTSEINFWEEDQENQGTLDSGSDFAPQTLTEEQDVDEVFREEEMELEALISLSEEQRSEHHEPRPSELQLHFGNDDDEYDNIFMDFLEGDTGSSIDTNMHMHDEDAMDMAR